MTRPIGRAAALALAAVLTTAAAAVAAAPQVAESPLFHIVLISDDAAPAAGQTLSTGLTGALEGVRGRLPFERYRIVDTAVARVRKEARVVLRGPKGERWMAKLDGHPTVREGRPAFVVERFSLRRADRVENTAVVAGEEPLEASFLIEPGETLVVGSSRLPDDNAFVVLVSALE